MSRKAQPAEPIGEYERFANRARFLEETSHGIHVLLMNSGKNQAWLSRRLGVSSSMVSKVLEGTHNFTLETLADVGLALDRTVHIVWGAEPGEMRIPVDEVRPNESRTVIPIAPFLSSSPHRHIIRQPDTSSVTYQYSAQRRGPVAMSEEA